MYNSNNLWMRGASTALGGGLNGHDIFEKIISLENLFLSWKGFKRGKMKKKDV